MTEEGTAPGTATSNASESTGASQIVTAACNTTSSSSAATSGTEGVPQSSSRRQPHTRFAMSREEQFPDTDSSNTPETTMATASSLSPSIIIGAASAESNNGATANAGVGENDNYDFAAGGDTGDLPLTAMDLLRRTDEAASLIQQIVRNRMLSSSGKVDKQDFGDVVDAAIELAKHDEDGDTVAEDDDDSDGEEEDEDQPWDMDRIYSLMLVAIFSLGMMIQRCVNCCKEKIAGDSDDNVDGVTEVFDAAGNTGTEFTNPVNGFGGGGGGSGAGGGGGKSIECKTKKIDKLSILTI